MSRRGGARRSSAEMCQRLLEVIERDASDWRWIGSIADAYFSGIHWREVYAAATALAAEGKIEHRAPGSPCYRRLGGFRADVEPLHLDALRRLPRPLDVRERALYALLARLGYAERRGREWRRTRLGDWAVERVRVRP